MSLKENIVLLATIGIFMISCGNANKAITEKSNNKEHSPDTSGITGEMDTATFGAGCFWCVEPIFAQLKGVESVNSGYMGGKIINPTYRDVSTGQSGHAEVIQIIFNPAEISYETLLEVFWSVHNPTTLNKQGADVGTQYRSVVFYHSPEQEESALKVKKEIGLANIWDVPIVTEIKSATKYYIAEGYHQDYYNLNPNEGYCKIVINPKVLKFRKQFEHLLK